ncbi:MAG TPA: condensation domain-containing protein, partial [Thermoanaerobaculia bacterium]|nr:condensation domain-containing protein [Thermoanaerobaculia bacterium]
MSEGRGEVTLTFGELDQRARAIGSRLQELSAEGERAVLLYPPGLDFIAAFFGCLYSGVVAVPAYPPRGNRGLPRLASIVADASPRVVLTTSALLPRIQSWLPTVAPDGTALIAMGALELEAAGSWRKPRLQPGTLAFLQYTSGSTALPKGVMVTHGNLLHNEESIRRAFGQSEESVIVSWLPLYHDMGLIGGVLQPLYVGASCVLMSPLSFLQEPLRWLEAISRFRGTTSGGPNFAYDLCVRRIGEEARAGLDLSSWSVAFNGAEPVRAETLDRFAGAFASCGFHRRAFYPCYGLAEGTLFVTGGVQGVPPKVGAFDAAELALGRVQAAQDEGAARRLVSCGGSWMGQEVVVVDPGTGAPAASGGVGEIWVSGPSVAQGYWGKPDATVETFAARLASRPDDAFLCTGDLGFFQNGELFVTGRLKDLVIIRGRNHYPQDIELTAEASHDAVRPGCSAAFSIDAGGEERLVLALELERRALSAPDVEGIAAAVRQAVAAEHEVLVHEVVLLRQGGVPKTSSGKVQRHAVRAGYLTEELDLVGRSRAGSAGGPAGIADGGTASGLSRDRLWGLEAEERRGALLAFLRQRVATATQADPAGLGMDEPLTALGLDSLSALQVLGNIEGELGVAASLAPLLEGCSLSQLADEVLERLDKAEASAALSPSEVLAAEPRLSREQEGLWLFEKLTPGAGVYNIAVAARVRGGVDAGRLRRSLQALVDRHPALRTTVRELGGVPVPEIRPAGTDMELREWDASSWSEEELLAHLHREAFRPFDLEHGPLLRVGLFASESGEAALCLAVHHMVADFWSLAVLAREWGILYGQGDDAARPALLQALPGPARRQAEALAGEAGQRLWAYWLERLAGELPVLELPADRPRPATPSFRAAAATVRLGGGPTALLHAASRRDKVTPYVWLLAAFDVLLHRYTGQTDLLVGSPTAGRRAAGLAGLVGYFVQPVALRTDLSGEPGFRQVVARVRATVAGALEHAELPLPDLVERLLPVRNPSRAPLFQILFVFQKSPLEAGDARGEALASFALGQPATLDLGGGLILESLPLAERRSQFDLTLILAETGDGFGATLEYASDLFDRPTMERLLGHFATLLDGSLADPERAVGELPLLATAERDQLLVEWNGTAAASPIGCLHELFAAQAARTPEAPAIVSQGRETSYGELERRSRRLARRLRALGVGPEVRVGVCLERTPDLVVALLGV